MSVTSRNICWRRCITPRSRWTAITHPLSAMTCTAADQPEKANSLRTAEMTLEDDYSMIDGVINNGCRGEEVEKARETAGRGEPEKKHSIRERLEDAKRECSERKPPDEGRPGREAPEHGEL